MNFRDKICERCNETFTPNSRTRKHCDTCYPIHRKEYINSNAAKYRAKRGGRVGVGSGGLQKERLGEKSPSFKTGIGIYREIMKRNNIPFICNKCNVPLDASKPFSWCTHHIDGNRYNNDLSNLEYLCKSCHQLEHKCWEALGIEIDEDDIEGVKEWVRERKK